MDWAITKFVLPTLGVAAIAFIPDSGPMLLWSSVVAVLVGTALCFAKHVHFIREIQHNRKE